MAENVNVSEKDTEETLPFATFLETVPPGRSAKILEMGDYSQSTSRTLSQPDIQLHCDSETCQGLRFFACRSPQEFLPGTKIKTCFMNYLCRNCRTTEKLYALFLVPDADYARTGAAIKLGELPSFGPPVPSRVISLIGPDREIFIRGRRAENQGLGIGAFAYYRRVVENQKGRLISEIGKVAKQLGADAKTLKEFEVAAKETQFTRAIDAVKHGIPQVLLINGHNPLSLLHSALSEGVHANTDEECLELATSIRVVLTELAERISNALKDEAEIRQALSRLLTREKQAGT